MYNEILIQNHVLKEIDKTKYAKIQTHAEAYTINRDIFFVFAIRDSRFCSVFVVAIPCHIDHLN